MSFPLSTRFRLRVRRKPRVSGFTLVELLLALAIVAALASIALPSYRGFLNRGAVAQATGELRALENEILAYLAANRELPPDLTTIGWGGRTDPWGTPWEYLPFPLDLDPSTPGAGKGGKPGAPIGARQDRFLVPVNSDFDLYSRGADRASKAPFTAAESRDDIVRAGNGAFMGLAVDF